VLKRTALEKLEYWRQHKTRQGLLVKGARQVGKTYLIREFAKQHYQSIVEINFLENKDSVRLFAAARDARELFASISLLAGKPLVKGETLVFLDEIQGCPEVLTAIKFLVEQNAGHAAGQGAGQDNIDFVLSGSLLGVELQSVESVPLGYLDTIEMYPLSFVEFCDAKGFDLDVFELLLDNIRKNESFNELIHSRLLSAFYEYLIVGGMPAAVQSYINNNDLQEVRNIQSNIVKLNNDDITKYHRKKALLIRNIYKLIPAQLNKQNKRFFLGNLKKNARFDRLENEFLWLIDAGVALAVHSVAEPTYPLLMNQESNLFKLFMNDVGLLTSTYMRSTAIEILAKNPYVNYGAIFENAVAQELHANGLDLYYYNSKKFGEIDLLAALQDSKIVPIEVKSGKDYQRHRALNNLLSFEDYRLDTGIVFCDDNFSAAGKVLYVPVYLAGLLGKIGAV